MKHIYPIYKPKGPTSHDIIDKLRKITRIKKIGHAGTLDPLAKGVLVVGITRAGTRELGKFKKLEKEYIAKIKLGEISDTDDEEGKKVRVRDRVRVQKNEIKKILKQFIGKIEQVPPVYSAIKISGKPAHRRVRKGEKIELKPRKVEIKNIKILNYKWPYLEIKIVCGSGTYIRSLARDIGKKLKCGAYLKELERIRVGKFKKKHCLSLRQLRICYISGSSH